MTQDPPSLTSADHVVMSLACSGNVNITFNVTRKCIPYLSGQTSRKCNKEFSIPLQTLIS